ncbi:hypothetical protein KGF56_000653 [Candida oxycetoniae]|uniref:Sulfhydryl oxidase n=1 Tax=Candida oxycetoniae TaxID=497107 RepID=A0AAI9WZL0_9ASCO|nr:uncharacterized protein KGF56_000653 [Candida oxycetoniae]KAI3406521.1 hypothetical protein KGF56_000653 [Candida oxycetoniae]
MTTSSTKSLGNSLPINLTKDSEKNEVDSFKQQNAQQQPLQGSTSDETVDGNHGNQPVSAEETGRYTTTAFMPKMANEELKQELGRASWRLFHTILARYPDKPTQQEETTLFTYIQLFAQVYPCGDCARHFQKLLAQFPPQTKSRKTAAIWGCYIHNKVNQRLKKNEYDCTTILKDYDCGCGSDELESDYTLKGESMEKLRNLRLEKEGLQKGG